MPILKKQFLPSVLTEHPEFKGACIRECVNSAMMGAPPSNSLAHTHVYPKDPFVGWICFLDLSCITDEQIMKHEMAHLLTSYHHVHDSAWRKKLLELGGHLNAYTLRIGKFQHNIPCQTAQCYTLDGMDPEEKLNKHDIQMQELVYKEMLRYRPSILEERERLVTYLNRYPTMKNIKDPQMYIRDRLTAVQNMREYEQLLSEVAVPIEVMYR